MHGQDSLICVIWPNTLPLFLTARCFEAVALYGSNHLQNLTSHFCPVTSFLREVKVFYSKQIFYEKKLFSFELRANPVLTLVEKCLGENNLH